MGRIDISMRAVALFAAASLWAGAAPSPESLSAKRKLATIQQGKAAPGSVVTFTPRDIDAWARVEVPKVVPRGFRDPRVQLGEGEATGYATVNFLEMRHAKPEDTNWLVSRLLEGERPLTVGVRVRSSGGWCTVDLTSVEISGVAARGAVLDFLIRTFFLSLYPEAKIGKPFELGYRIERIEIHPGGLAVRISGRRNK